MCSAYIESKRRFLSPESAPPLATAPTTVLRARSPSDAMLPNSSMSSLPVLDSRRSVGAAPVLPLELEKISNHDVSWSPAGPFPLPLPLAPALPRFGVAGGCGVVDGHSKPVEPVDMGGGWWTPRPFGPERCEPLVCALAATLLECIPGPPAPCWAWCSANASISSRLMLILTFIGGGGGPEPSRGGAPE